MRCAIAPLALMIASLVLVGCTDASDGDTPDEANTDVIDSTSTSIVEPGPPGAVRTATGALDGPRDERIGPPANARPVEDPSVAQEGACLNEIWVDNEDGSSQRLLVAAPCDGPHDAEVFAAFVMAQSEVAVTAGVDRPSDRDLHRGASALCLERFEGFVGKPYETSLLAVSVLRPTPVTWETNDRSVACSVYDSEFEPLIGTMRNSGR